MPNRVIRRRFSLELAGTAVPSVMLLPDSPQRMPAVLLLHGYSSSKERLAGTMGQSLAARGIASLAIDLPLHGSREDAILDDARSNPADLVRHWNTALVEARAALSWLSAHEQLDSRAIHVAGYSLGSYIALQTAAADHRVRSAIVAAGGDLPVTPWTAMLRVIADPLASAKSLDARPLLMLHGRRDQTIKSDQAQRLYDAASDPKELRWYDSGHVLPAVAADDAAAWIIQQADGSARARDSGVSA